MKLLDRSALRVRIWLMVILSLLCIAYILPWEHLLPTSTTATYLSPPYQLGLDLRGGVELDYLLDSAEANKRIAGTDIKIEGVIEGIKMVIENRVRSLIPGSEPNTYTKTYKGEYHIIVQIPTKQLSNEALSPADKRAQDAAYLVEVKQTIGKVLRLEFKERNTTITDADRGERRKLAEAAFADLLASKRLSLVSQKYTAMGEVLSDGSGRNIRYGSGSKPLNELPFEAQSEQIKTLSGPTVFPVILPEITTVSEKFATLSGTAETSTGYSLIVINGIRSQQVPVAAQSGASQTGAQTKQQTTVDYEYLYISQAPSEWKIARGDKGQDLDDTKLKRASAEVQNGVPLVTLQFNDEGKQIFKEITTRLVGQPIAIFVGGELLTSPNVNEPIIGGSAQITGERNLESAKILANSINTGLVPAPIYLSSERTINAKIGDNALGKIMIAGAIGFVLILVFMLITYRLSGLLAICSLLIYVILLLFIVKSTGIVLTLSSIAGLILSIGLAIDANILIFERFKEELRSGVTTEKALMIGFDKSWSAIRDSHITSLVSALVLYVAGTNLIRGFGLMLGIGILLSLFTAIYVSRVFLLAVVYRFGRNLAAFIGKI